MRDETRTIPSIVDTALGRGIRNTSSIATAPRRKRPRRGPRRRFCLCPRTARRAGRETGRGRRGGGTDATSPRVRKPSRRSVPECDSQSSHIDIRSRSSLHMPHPPVARHVSSESSPRRPPRVLSSRGDTSRESEVSVTGLVMAFAYSSAVDVRVEYSGWESDGGTFPLHRSIVRRIGHAQYLSVVPC